jgi:outer membrane murein-binding lipoprotein Lpp
LAIVTSILSGLLVGCVSQQKYDALESDYN